MLKRRDMKKAKRIFNGSGAETAVPVKKLIQYRLFNPRVEGPIVDCKVDNENTEQSKAADNINRLNSFLNWYWLQALVLYLLVCLGR